MTAGLSIYLDLVRFVAELAVFLFHLGYGKLAGGAFSHFVQFGTAAVIVFFVLSGFVISHVRGSREQTLRSYALARLARLYSVALPALAITALCDGVGHLARADLYPIPLSMTAFLRCLTFTNQLWGHGYPFGSAVTYWSLGFEVCYYVLFGVAVFATGLRRVALFALVAGVAGPGILTLLPIWLLGCGCYWLCGRSVLAPSWGWWLFGASLAGFALMLALDALQPIAHGIGYTATQLVVTYAVATLFSAHLVGAHLVSATLLRVLEWARAPIQWLAGATFTLYLLHLPIAFLIRSTLPVDAGPALAGGVTLVGTLVAILMVAEATERRKARYRRFFERVFSVATTVTRHSAAAVTSAPRR